MRFQTTIPQQPPAELVLAVVMFPLSLPRPEIKTSFDEPLCILAPPGLCPPSRGLKGDLCVLSPSGFLNSNIEALTVFACFRQLGGPPAPIYLPTVSPLDPSAEFFFFRFFLRLDTMGPLTLCLLDPGSAGLRVVSWKFGCFPPSC